MKNLLRPKMGLLALAGVVLTQVSAMATSLPRSISPQALAQEKGCFACHAIDHKVVGPAWKDVAAKYHHNLKYVPDLAKKIKNGNAGIWGPVPMPPQNVTQAQAEELARFILSLH
ncbi:cytochrome c class I [Hydrogenobaculum sp. Y04AAS1]|uniref:c-type cytochrome n=1 Tax=Hydrogenobaculum sp. (strain Y04AAS1) TaxID=380749 RepID=UPI00015BD063|nr:cytochrome c class I [Hydrogenobaculum sp. Y04AAS1]HCT66592.1 cytochrome c class I [Hydrogenobaculum sp.]